MAVFPSDYFTYSTRYPDSGARIQFGGSYQFDTLPDSPDQRIFVLHFSGMKYFLTAGGAIDKTVFTNRNMGVLEQFYLDNKKAIAFTFNHPVYGALQCKFNRPLEIPEGIVGGDGVVQPFDVELIEIP